MSRVRRAYSLLELLVVIALIAALTGLTLAAVQKVRASGNAVRCRNHVKQLGLALHGYHDSHGHLPAGVRGDRSDEPQPYLGWCARVLPHLGEDAVWRDIEAAFRQDRDFLHVPPHAHGATVIKYFTCPADPRVQDAHTFKVDGSRRAFTSYLGVNGTRADYSDGVLFLDSRVRLADVGDGTSNTLAVGERPPSGDFVFGWWYAGWGQHQDGEADLVLGAKTRNTSVWGERCGQTGPFEYKAGEFSDPCAPFQFWSPHPDGAHFLFADGSVRFLSYSANPILPALASRAGGETEQVP